MFLVGTKFRVHLLVRWWLLLNVQKRLFFTLEKIYVQLAFTSEDGQKPGSVPAAAPNLRIPNLKLKSPLVCWSR